MSASSTPFGEWLAAGLQARGISQAEAARQIGVADAQVSRWRRGQVVPSLKHARQIAAAFGVAPATIEHLIAPDVGSGNAKADPVQQAELDAGAARLATVLRERVPSALWPAYVRACEALAEQMVTAFDHALEAGRPEHDHPIGFHLRNDQ